MSIQWILDPEFKDTIELAMCQWTMRVYMFRMKIQIMKTYSREFKKAVFCAFRVSNQLDVHVTRGLGISKSIFY